MSLSLLAALVSGLVSHGVPDAADLAVASVGNCSAVLVAPRVLVTAAHCVEGFDVSNLDAFFGADRQQGTGTLIPVIELHLHPAWDPITITNDAALLLLADPSAVAPVPLMPRALDDSFVGARVRSVGFGVTSPADPSSGGIKREGTATLRSFDATTFTDDALPSSTCAGDSGGATLLIVDGVEVLAGIASRGDAACAAFDVKTRVDVLRDSFIGAYVAATQPGAARLGDSCAYDAQCASGRCAVALDDPALRYCTQGCTSNGGCDAPLVCSTEHSCRYMGPTPGALGAACERDSDCHSRQCEDIVVGGTRACTVGCVPDAVQPCSAGFACKQMTGGDFACVAAASRGGCSVLFAAREPAADDAVAVAALLALLTFGAVARRRRSRAWAWLLLIVGGCASKPAVACGNGAPSLALGTSGSDGSGFVALVDGRTVPLIYGPQGGFHTWSNVSVRNVCPDGVRLDRVARDVASGDTLVTLHDTVTLQLTSDGSAQLPAARPTFLCPNDVGRAIPGATIEVRATVTDRNGVQASDAHIMVAACPTDAQAALCASLCGARSD